MTNLCIIKIPYNYVFLALKKKFGRKLYDILSYFQATQKKKNIDTKIPKSTSMWQFDATFWLKPCHFITLYILTQCFKLYLFF